MSQRRRQAQHEAATSIFRFNNPHVLARLRNSGSPTHTHTHTGGGSTAGAVPHVSVDLHGLRVDEVKELLVQLLDKRVWVVRRRHNRKGAAPHASLVVSLITGRGAHSVGRSKLHPAVLAYVRSLPKSRLRVVDIGSGSVDTLVVG